MKMQKQVAVAVSLMTLFAATSCVKSVNVDPQKQKIDTMKDLVVPPNFDWSTSKSIECTINSATPTSVELYTDPECTQELLAKFIANVGDDNVLPLTVAQSTTKLYLKYRTAAATNKIIEQRVDNGIVSFNITDGDLTRTKADVPIYNGFGYISYPSGWGNVMFEDLYPSTGDYDFNDFVAAYQISIEFPWRNGGYDTKYVDYIRIHLKLKAIGGLQEFTPYVRILGLNKNNVTIPRYAYDIESPGYANPLIMNNTVEGVQARLVDGSQTSDAVFEFINLNGNNGFKVEGASFYNTTPGKITKGYELTEVVVYVKLNNEVRTKELLDEKIDIFLANSDKSKEIHLRGFSPVFSAYDFNVNGVHKTIPYASANNLVWGIKTIKGSTKHVAEKIDFCKAYSDFGNWAQSGGVANQDWYLTNINKQCLIEWKR